MCALRVNLYMLLTRGPNIFYYGDPPYILHLFDHMWDAVFEDQFIVQCEVFAQGFVSLTVSLQLIQTGCQSYNQASSTNTSCKHQLQTPAANTNQRQATAASTAGGINCQHQLQEPLEVSLENTSCKHQLQAPTKSTSCKSSPQVSAANTSCKHQQKGPAASTSFNPQLKVPAASTSCKHQLHAPAASTS